MEMGDTRPGIDSAGAIRHNSPGARYGAARVAGFSKVAWRAN